MSPKQGTLDFAAPTATPIPEGATIYAAVCAAITRSAAEHNRLVHISWVRPYLPEWAVGPQVGSAFSALRMLGNLSPTNHKPLPNGDTAAGNGTKLARVSRLTRPIDA